MEATPAIAAWPEATAAGALLPPAPAPVAPQVPPGPHPAPPAPSPSPSPASRDPDEAIRWRLNAAITDVLIQIGLAVLVVAALSAQGVVLSVWAGVALGVLGSWLYHFVFESQGGQTPGKKRFGVKVVRLDGGRAEPWRIALRNLLRGVDEFGPLSASGLITMWLSGPAHRQRIGDKAAGTLVVPVSGCERRGPSPRWLLPALASLSILIGIAEVDRAVHAPSHRPAPSPAVPPPGPATAPLR